MILQTTLTLAAAAVLINLWIFIRIVRLRAAERIVHGDGGHPLLMRRMRAHANFTENAPLLLVLVGAIELSGKGGRWLAIVGAVFMIARLAHVIGMDSPKANPVRAAGTVASLATLLGLAAMAVLIALERF
ncbi:MAG: MAPEG family protein [Novosphingobium sp.]